MDNSSLSFFSQAEGTYYLKFRAWRDRIFLPLCEFLSVRKVTPAFVTGAGGLMVVGFVYFFLFNPWISFVFLALNLFLDALDGSLARYQKVQNTQGDLLDHAFDNLSFFVIFLTFLAFQLVHSFWAAVFLLNYSILIFFMVILSARKVSLFLVVRAKYFVYLVFFWWLLTGANFFNPVVIFFSVYMVVTNVFLFHKLRCSLS